MKKLLKMLTDIEIENLKKSLDCGSLDTCPLGNCEICREAFKRFEDYSLGCPCYQVGKKKVIRKAKQVIKVWEDQQKGKELLK